LNFILKLLMLASVAVGYSGYVYLPCCIDKSSGQLLAIDYVNCHMHSVDPYPDDGYGFSPSYKCEETRYSSNSGKIKDCSELTPCVKKEKNNCN